MRWRTYVVLFLCLPLISLAAACSEESEPTSTGPTSTEVALTAQVQGLENQLRLSESQTRAAEAEAKRAKDGVTKLAKQLFDLEEELDLTETALSMEIDNNEDLMELIRDLRDELENLRLENSFPDSCIINGTC